MNGVETCIDLVGLVEAYLRPFALAASSSICPDGWRPTSLGGLVGDRVRFVQLCRPASRYPFLGFVAFLPPRRTCGSQDQPLRPSDPSCPAYLVSGGVHAGINDGPHTARALALRLTPWWRCLQCLPPSLCFACIHAGSLAWRLHTAGPCSLLGLYVAPAATALLMVHIHRPSASRVRTWSPNLQP